MYGTGGLNLHSQLLYAASSYILHANETINTPTHLSEASPCQGVKQCAVPHYRSLTALQLFIVSQSHAMKNANLALSYVVRTQSSDYRSTEVEEKKCLKCSMLENCLIEKGCLHFIRCFFRLISYPTNPLQRTYITRLQVFWMILRECKG